MEINAAALRRLADEVDRPEVHRADALAGGHAQGHVAAGARASRRRFLLGAGAGGAGLTLGSVFLPWRGLLASASAATTQGGAASGDEQLLVFAAGVERAAAAAYDEALGRDQFDAEIAAVAKAFRNHHRQHAETLAALVGRPSQANTALVNALRPQVRRASNQDALLRVVFDLENAAAATYLLALERLTSPNAAKAAASILPIEARHALVLGQALGLGAEELVPTFESTDDAATPDQFPQ